MTITEFDLNYLRSTIATRSGNIIPTEQSYLLEARLHPVAAAAGLKDVGALVAELQGSPSSDLHDEVTEAMTINETSFFRNEQPFNLLRNGLIRELAERRQSERSLSFWSAASSSGQEAYSIGMVLKSDFPELADWILRIDCTDYSEAMVRRVREGLYSPFEVSRGLPHDLLQKYFSRSGLKWKVKQELREMITASRLNLTEDRVPPKKYDFIFLRNVLIYFDSETKHAILRRMHQALRSDGYLFLGAGENLVRTDVPFERLTIGRTVCFRPIPNQEP